MGCEHCVKSVREALETVKGIKILDVKIGSAEIEAENDGVLSEIKEKLDDIYNAHYYIIGTSDFIKTMKTLLEKNHIDKKNYLVDNFG